MLTASSKSRSETGYVEPASRRSAQRTGARIRANVESALVMARSSGAIEGGPFWSIPKGKIQVRDRSAVLSSSLRNPESLPPSEIDEAIRQVIDRSVAIGPEELAKGISDALGFGSTTALLKGASLDLANALIAAGGGIELGETFKLDPSNARAEDVL